MVFKGCQRCRGDLWVEEDIGSRLEDLVCLQCGHRQAAQGAGPGLSVEDMTSRRRPAPDRVKNRSHLVRTGSGARGDRYQQLATPQASSCG
jgi:hypothetical protein